MVDASLAHESPCAIVLCGLPAGLEYNGSMLTFIPTKSRRIAEAVLLSLAVTVLAAPAAAQFRYDTEYPVIGYGKTPTTDAFTLAMQQHAGSLQHDALGRGYLDSLLAALNIDPASQVLVFSKTSLKQRFITAENPRSLFFNDEVYVGFEQQTSRCLRCHDSYSMTGGGVPRFMLSSVYAGPDGNLVSHELSEMTDTTTPLERRWGGWYVTGMHGSQRTLGNLVIRDTSVLRDPELAGVANVMTLDSIVALPNYLRPTSDIVALLVLEHQVEVQNRLTRLNYASRMQLAQGALDVAALDTLTRPLLDSLFMAHEASLGAPVTGSSEFAANFQLKGLVDMQGRSLREFDLQTRTFRYPLSFLIYSDAIKGLPDSVRKFLFTRIKAVLESAPDAPEYPHLSADQRSTILAILRDTKPEVVE